jgi:hypothetical protein
MRRSALLALLVGALVPTAAHAADRTYVVGTSADQNALSYPNPCATEAAGCSLREVLHVAQTDLQNGISGTVRVVRERPDQRLRGAR